MKKHVSNTSKRKQIVNGMLALAVSPGRCQKSYDGDCDGDGGAGDGGIRLLALADILFFTQCPKIGHAIDCGLLALFDKTTTLWADCAKTKNRD